VRLALQDRAGRAQIDHTLTAKLLRF